MLFSALIAPVFALFCLNATQADMDQSVKNLKVVDAALEVNDFARALIWLDWAYGPLDDAKRALRKDGKLVGGGRVDPPSPGLVRHAARDRALLLSRDPKSTAAQRERAKKIYEFQVLGTNPDPATLADYGEILSRVPAHTALATTTLRALRAKDLIGSAHASASLAELEKAAGDIDAEAAARAKCKLQTKVPAICEPSAAPSPGRVTPEE